MALSDRRYGVLYEESIFGLCRMAAKPLSDTLTSNDLSVQSTERLTINSRAIMA